MRRSLRSAVHRRCIPVNGERRRSENRRCAITPGEARPITLKEVCDYAEAEVISRDIPLDMQRKVFAEWGSKTQGNQFEVDYLITPDLGGTESIRNLWPQPYSAHWNARVKDKLEERLHELVCSGKLDLETPNMTSPQTGSPLTENMLAATECKQ